MTTDTKHEAFAAEESMEQGSEKLEHDLAAADDEAIKVFANYTGSLEWSQVEEKAIRRKIDWRLMPILCITYMLQYWDKAMLGQAAIFGLIPDLGLSKGNRYSFSAAIFYLGFICGAYPAVVLAQRYPIERVTSGIVTIWGICLLLTIACSNYQGLYAQRFFLGFLESGISPMFMIMVGSWYRKDEQAFRMGMWYSLTGWSSVVSPLINYGIGHITTAMSPWKWMYVVAGALTTIWGILLLFILPPDPIRARGFNERERYIMVARLRSNNSGVRNTTFKLDQVVELLLDIKFWLIFFIALLSMIANGPISSFAPIIIRGFGYNTLQTLLLFMPAGVYAGTMMLLTSFLAMKFSHKNIRTYIVFATQCGTILASALLWKVDRTNRAALFYGIYTLSTYGAGYGVLMGVHLANNAGYTKRSFASSGLYVGYCIGNFIGPLIFFERESPVYNTGFGVVTATSVLAAALMLVYRGVCIWENRKRNKVSTEAFDHAFEDPTDKQNVQFRYIY